MKAKLFNILLVIAMFFFNHAAYAVRIEELDSDGEVIEALPVAPERHTESNRQCKQSTCESVNEESALKLVVDFARKKANVFRFDFLNHNFFPLLFAFIAMKTMQREEVPTWWRLIGGLGIVLALKIPFAVQKWYINKKFTAEEQEAIRGLQGNPYLQQRRDIGDLYSYHAPRLWQAFRQGNYYALSRIGADRGLSGRAKYYFVDALLKAKGKRNDYGVLHRIACALDWCY